MDLIVIYDAEKEIAAAVDADTRLAFGPAMIGANAGDVLEAFFATIPYDVDEVGSFQLRAWFEQFLESLPATDVTPPQSDTADTVEQDGRVDMAATESLAEQEARQHSDTPAEQPADADMEADEGPPEYVGECWACGGNGTVPAGPNETVMCTVCEGTGNLPVVHS